MGLSKFFDSLSTDQIVSKSLPIWRVYKDGSDVVAVDETYTEIDRNTDAQTVWQSAADAANTAFDANEPFEPVAVIDGGSLEYDLDSQLTIKDGAVVENARFEASGIGTAPALDIGGPDDGFSHRAITVRDVTVRDAGQAAFRFDSVAICKFERLLAENPTANAFQVRSAIGNHFDRITARNAGGEALTLNNTGNTAASANANLFSSFRAISCGQVNIIGTAKGNVFVLPVIESSTGDGLVIASGNTNEGNTLIFPWFEGNTNIGADIEGTRTVIWGGTYSSNDTGGSNRGIRARGTREQVYGPVRGGDTIVMAGTDQRVANLRDSVFTDNGTRTLVNGLGQEAASGTPTAANWEPGDLVEDTNNAGDVYLLMRDGSTWTQVAT